MRLQANRDVLLKCNGPSTIRRSSYNETGGQTPVVIITPDIQNVDSQRRKNNNIIKISIRSVILISTTFQKSFVLF